MLCGVRLESLTYVLYGPSQEKVRSFLCALASLREASFARKDAKTQRKYREESSKWRFGSGGTSVMHYRKSIVCVFLLDLVTVL